MIPESFIQELLARVDIVDVVARYVKLRKGGANLIGLCPFHNEKTASFTVSPTKQFYHCFGCGAHGSAIRFLTQHTGLTFPEAVESLAASVGLTVPSTQRSPEQIKADRARKDQITTEQDLLRKACSFYRKTLKASPKAIAYLKGRGLSGEIAGRFKLGWAGADKRELATVFENYDSSALVDSGLVIEAEDGRRYDRFRNRIMFPILNARGHLIGFGGRLIEKGEPKYLNSPETSLFSKGKELYGLYEARAGINKFGYVLVVEGYMDVIALAQNGLDNAVATLGTATTSDHIQKLQRQTNRIVFCFDGDNAGKKAAWRALQTCLPWASEDLGIRFLFLPDNYDPDSYIREFGLDATLAYVDEALALSAFMLQELSARHDLTEVEGRSACVHEARPLLAQIPDGGYKIQLEREFANLVRLTPEELTGLLHVTDDLPAEYVTTDTYRPVTETSLKPKPNKTARNSYGKRKSRTVTPLAKRLLGLLLAYPDLIEGLGDRQLELLAKHPHLQLVREMVDLVGRCGATHTGAVLEATDPDSDLANALLDLSTELLVQELPDPLAECNDALRVVEIQFLQDQCDSLIAHGLSTAEQQKQYKILIKKLTELKRQG